MSTEHAGYTRAVSGLISLPSLVLSGLALLSFHTGCELAPPDIDSDENAIGGQGMSSGSEVWADRICKGSCIGYKEPHPDGYDIDTFACSDATINPNQVDVYGGTTAPILSNTPLTECGKVLDCIVNNPNCLVGDGDFIGFATKPMYGKASQLYPAKVNVFPAEWHPYAKSSTPQKPMPMHFPPPAINPTLDTGKKICRASDRYHYEHEVECDGSISKDIGPFEACKDSATESAPRMWSHGKGTVPTSYDDRYCGLDKNGDRVPCDNGEPFNFTCGVKTVKAVLEIATSELAWPNLAKGILTGIEATLCFFDHYGSPENALKAGDPLELWDDGGPVQDTFTGVYSEPGLTIADGFVCRRDVTHQWMHSKHVVLYRYLRKYTNWVYKTRGFIVDKSILGVNKFPTGGSWKVKATEPCVCRKDNGSLGLNCATPDDVMPFVGDNQPNGSHAAEGGWSFSHSSADKDCGEEEGEEPDYGDDPYGN